MKIMSSNLKTEKELTSCDIFLEMGLHDHLPVELERYMSLSFIMYWLSRVNVPRLRIKVEKTKWNFFKFGVLLCATYPNGHLRQNNKNLQHYPIVPVVETHFSEFPDLRIIKLIKT